MSDLATSHDDGTFEPDEETLMSALRNQDDIPILMDIVDDGIATSYTKSDSQEAHLQHSFAAKVECLDKESSEQSPSSDLHNKVVEEAQKPITQSNTLTVSSEQVNRAIVEALEKRLPDLMATLVAEVMQNLHASSVCDETPVNAPPPSS